MEEIDRENNEKLNKMSKAEILAAQKEIAQALDPSLIEALKRLGRAKKNKEALYLYPSYLPFLLFVFFILSSTFLSNSFLVLTLLSPFI